MCLGTIPLQQQAHVLPAALVGPCMAVGAHFLDEGEAVPTKGLPERSSRRPHRVRPMLVNLRSCASKQHVAGMESRRDRFPYSGVRRRPCRKPNVPFGPVVP